MTFPLIFDGHNDLLFQMDTGTITLDGFLNGAEGTHIDIPRARAGGLAGGFFAIFAPGDLDGAAFMKAMAADSYDIPLPDPLTWSEGAMTSFRQAAHLMSLDRAGALRICRTTAEIEKTLGSDRLAAVMHLEGAEAIDADLHTLDILHAAGLRSIGPVWSRPTIFGHGVSMRFPGDPDTGPGLTDVGKALVRRCNDLGILIDLSHLNEAGMNDVAAISTAPLVATHSNAHALCPSPRNLTDRQLMQIAESDGIVGLNFAATFLRDDGRMAADFGIGVMVRHLDHLIDRLGEDRVGFGSDFDGALVSEEINDCTGLPTLMSALRSHGYDDALLTKLAHGNWLRVLRRTFGE